MLILEVVTPVARRAGNARAHLFSRSAAAAEHPEAFAERIAARTSRVTTRRPSLRKSQIASNCPAPKFRRNSISASDPALCEKAPKMFPKCTETRMAVKRVAWEISSACRKSKKHTKRLGLSRRCFLGPSSLVVLPHGCYPSEVLRAAFCGFCPAPRSKFGGCVRHGIHSGAFVQIGRESQRSVQGFTSRRHRRVRIRDGGQG